MPQPRRRVSIEPLPDLARGNCATADLETLVRFGFGGHERLEKAVAQDAELEIVEELMDLLPVPAGVLQLLGRVRQLDVAHHLGQLPVEQDAGQVRAQRLAHLAADLVDPVDEGVEIAVLADPLGGGLLPHTGDAGQIVARVAAQRRVVGVLRGREPVLAHHLVGGEPGEVGDALARVEDGDVVVDELDGVAVAGDHEHPVAERLGLGGEGGDDVVGLETGFGHHRDAERAEHVLGQLDLTAELVGRAAAVGLVLGVRLGAEGLPRHVERGADVRRLLVAQQVDQHRREPVHRVGGLPADRLEVLRRQREERPKCQRVTVEQHQRGTGVGGLSASGLHSSGLRLRGGTGWAHASESRQRARQGRRSRPTPRPGTPP